MRRLSFTVMLALPVIVLAMLAKPLVLGEGVLFLGLLLAFAVPMLWVVLRR